MVVNCYCARRTARLDSGNDWSGVFKTSGIPNESSIGSRRCWRKGFYRLALGYEDLNDHEQLRQGPLWP